MGKLATHEVGSAARTSFALPAGESVATFGGSPHLIRAFVIETILRFDFFRETSEPCRRDVRPAEAVVFLPENLRARHQSRLELYKRTNRILPLSLEAWTTSLTAFLLDKTVGPLCAFR
jgi:hypothetical protein